MGTAKVLMIGDIVGKAGMRAVSALLKTLVAETGADAVVANGENATGGTGISREDAESLLALGVDAITGGNHIWEGKDAHRTLAELPALLRPANYPGSMPDGRALAGSGTWAFETRGIPWAVINVQGRESMTPIDCPFRIAMEAARGFRQEGRLVVVDFHSESVEEREALARHLDGVASAFAGTHTHVQTADERVLPGGTGFLGDLGMTGADSSVIGFEIPTCLERAKTQMPLKMACAEGPARVHGALFEIDRETGRCLSVSRVRSEPA